jgi:hypothetical protein
MRATTLTLIGVLPLAMLAACDSSSSSSSSGGFTFDGGTYTAPDGGTTPSPDGGTAGADGGDGGDPDSGGSVPCTVTLAGAVTKTIACTTSAAFDSQGNTSGVGITSPAIADGVPEATFAIEVAGELAATTYTWATSTTQGGTVYEGSAATWAVNSGNAQGSSAITVSSANVIFTSADGKLYAAHGTVTATLIDQSGTGAADVTMTITF